MLLMTACVTLWSFTGLLAKLIPWNGVALAGWRGFISAGVLFAYMKKAGEKPLRDGRTLLIGICVAGAAIFCLLANKLTTAANVIMLQYTSPVFVIVLSAFIGKRKYRAFDYLIVALTILGVVMFFFDKLTPGNIAGNLLSLLLGATYGGMFFLCEGVSQQQRLSGILWGFLLTGIIGAPFIFFTENLISWQSAGLVLLMALAFYSLPYILYALSLRDCPALAAILISTLEIILNPIWVYLFLRETPGRWAAIGSCVILSAVTAYSINKAKNKDESPKTTLPKERLSMYNDD